MTDKYIVTAVAEVNQKRFNGQIRINVYSTQSLELLWEVQSNRIASQPSVQLLSIDDDGSILLSVWDRDMQNYDEEWLDDDCRDVIYYAVFLNTPDLHPIETVSNSNARQSKIFMIDRKIYNVTIER